MRPLKNLFPTITSFENLYSAFLRARKGKRFQQCVCQFDQRLEENLLELQQALRADSYFPGEYRLFHIYEPKQRLISAAPFRDRVVHHALIDVLEPRLDASLIEDTYACRRGKGTHKALDRCREFVRRFPFVLHCDVRKYFPSIDHKLLLKQLRKRIGDSDVLRLLTLILHMGPQQEPVLAWFDHDDLLTPLYRRKGIPIGNLTSQFFANLFLDPLDRMIKQDLRIKGYIRYMDDMLIFGRSVDELLVVRDAIQNTLTEYRLELHPRKRQVYPTPNGIPFLGFRVLPDRVKLLPDNVRRARKRLRLQVRLVNQGKLTLTNFQQSMQAWIGHAGYGDTWRLRSILFYDYVSIHSVR